jgi:hypothetical protein
MLKSAPKSGGSERVETSAAKDRRRRFGIQLAMPDTHQFQQRRCRVLDVQLLFNCRLQVNCRLQFKRRLIVTRTVLPKQAEVPLFKLSSS